MTLKDKVNCPIIIEPYFYPYLQYIKNKKTIIMLKLSSQVYFKSLIHYWTICIINISYIPKKKY